MENKNVVTMRILIHCEQGIWVAQGLDYDIAAQGKTIEAALTSFQSILSGQFLLDMSNNRALLEGFERAPGEYWDKFNRGFKLEVPDEDSHYSSLVSLAKPVADHELRIYA